MYNLEDFKDHVAHYWSADMGGRLEKIIFANPGCSNYYIEFVSYRGVLVVTGDLYDAIYEVSQSHPLTWWGNTDAGYMSDKMRGPNGYSEEKMVWDHESAVKDLKALYDELVKTAREDDEKIPQQDGPEWDAWVLSLNRIDDFELDSARSIKMWHELEPEDHISEQHEWREFVRENGETIWGSDWWEGSCSSVGMIRNPVVIAHLEGLQRALAQLKANGVKMFGET